MKCVVRTEITADEIREAFGLPQTARLTLLSGFMRAPNIPVEKISIGSEMVPTIESDATYIPG